MVSRAKTMVCGAALAVAAAMSVAAWSMGPHDGMGADPARIIGHMSERLDLSAEQQTQVDNLLASAKQANAADHKRMGELRGELMALRDNYDAGKAQAIADEIGQITGRMVYRASDTWSQVYQLLNAQQKAELNGLLEKWSEGRGQRAKGSREEAP